MSLTLIVDNNNYIFFGRSMQITKDKNLLLKPYHKQILNYGIQIHHRDENAKLNLLQEGIRLLTTDFNIQII